MLQISFISSSSAGAIYGYFVVICKTWTCSGYLMFVIYMPINGAALLEMEIVQKLNNWAEVERKEAKRLMSHYPLAAYTVSSHSIWGTIYRYERACTCQVLHFWQLIQTVLLPIQRPKSEGDVALGRGLSKHLNEWSVLMFSLHLSSSLAFDIRFLKWTVIGPVASENRSIFFPAHLLPFLPLPLSSIGLATSHARQEGGLW